MYNFIQKIQSIRVLILSTNINCMNTKLIEYSEKIWSKTTTPYETQEYQWFLGEFYQQKCEKTICLPL